MKTHAVYKIFINLSNLTFSKKCENFKSFLIVIKIFYKLYHPRLFQTLAATLYCSLSLVIKARTMLNSVCCIIDVDGFDIRNFDEYGQYSTEFLVRELGYIRVDPNYQYMANSYRFNLRQKVNLAQCSPKVRQTLNYQSRNVIGLTVLPRPDERDVRDYSTLRKVLQDIYDFCRRPNANVVAYKGGDKELKLLESMNIPCVDLQSFGCSPYRDLARTGKRYSDCGYHTELKGDNLIHCPMAEVTAYRDWFMKNYRRFSSPA